VNITLSNDELIALAAMAKATADKYNSMIEEMRESNRARVMGGQPPEDYDTEINEAQLFAAIWESFWQKLQERGFKIKGKYSFDLKPVWAFALRLEYNGLVDVTTQIGNSVQMLCNEIHKQFA